MAELHETMYGKKLLEGDIPGIKKALERIACALEKQNRTDAILNTIKNSTIEDAADVIKEIEKDEKDEKCDKCGASLDAYSVHTKYDENLCSGCDAKRLIEEQ